MILLRLIAIRDWDQTLRAGKVTSRGAAVLISVEPTRACTPPGSLQVQSLPVQSSVSNSTCGFTRIYDLKWFKYRYQWYIYIYIVRKLSTMLYIDVSWLFLASDLLPAVARHQHFGLKPSTMAWQRALRPLRVAGKHNIHQSSRVDLHS